MTADTMTYPTVDTDKYGTKVSTWKDGSVIKYEHSDGGIDYCRNGRMHNAEGPATIFPDGGVRYYLNGERLTESEWKRRTGR